MAGPAARNGTTDGAAPGPDAGYSCVRGLRLGTPAAMLGGLLAPPRPLAAGNRVMREGTSMAGWAARATLSIAPGPTAVLDAAATFARRTVAGAGAVSRETRPATSSLGDLGPDREHRRVWAGHGHG